MAPRRPAAPRLQHRQISGQGSAHRQLLALHQYPQSSAHRQHQALHQYPQGSALRQLLALRQLCPHGLLLLPQLLRLNLLPRLLAHRPNRQVPPRQALLSGPLPPRAQALVVRGLAARQQVRHGHPSANRGLVKLVWGNRALAPPDRPWVLPCPRARAAPFRQRAAWQHPAPRRSPPQAPCARRLRPLRLFVPQRKPQTPRALHRLFAKICRFLTKNFCNCATLSTSSAAFLLLKTESTLLKTGFPTALRN